MDGGTFDFIVTGAGSAGCAVAARLSESGRYRVLLLEAGKRDSNPWIHLPIGYQKLFTSPTLNWRYDTAPLDSLNGRTLYQPRGKMLGGTSSLNGLAYMRGTPGDYDHWRQLGCEGWDFDSVLPYFRKAEDQERGADHFHGVGGPVKVSDGRFRSDIVDAAMDAAVEAGFERNPDFNGAKQEGVGYYQATAAKGLRWSTAVAYLKPARGRKNLVVVTDAHVTRVVVKSGRAVGVEYRTPAGHQSAQARGEVIVSGGVYGSPQLLQLSGIGAGEELRDLGIDVVHDLPAVGENLQDHFNTLVSWRITRRGTLNDLAISPTRQVAAGLQYILDRTGPLAGSASPAGIMARSDPRFEQPDLQINILLWSVASRDRNKIHAHKWPGLTLGPVHLRPDGRGKVSLKSRDPLDQPRIELRFLETQYDIDAMLYGMRLSRRIAQQPALRGLIAEEVLPGPAVTSDEALIEDLRKRGVSNLHAVGSCRMGTGADAVVDPRLRVHGLSGLRVVDASIMPRIPGGNTNGPTIMIAEKAADMILADAKAA